MKHGEPRCVLEWKATVGECPTWHPLEARLYWVDIQEKKIHRFDPALGINETFELPEIVTSLALRASGGLVLTLEKDFAFYDPATEVLERISAVEATLPKNRFNDGKCDPRGRYWAGTMDAKEWSSPAGHLFRLDARRHVETMASNVICSNGTGWSPDGRTMYYTESFRYAVFAYDFDLETGEVANRRTFAALDERDRNAGGFPDGLTVDTEGFVWSNVVGLGQIRRYDPNGRLERTLLLPVPRATSCTFGGPEAKTLFVTTARETLSAADLRKAPLSGSLFAVDVELAGLPSTPFEG